MNSSEISQELVPEDPPTLYYDSNESRGVFAEVWAFRELLWSFIVRDLKTKYQQSVLGFAWTIMAPAIMVSILVVVFGQFVRIEMDNYWAFLLSGFFLWNFLAGMANRSATLLVAHANLRRSVVFPGEVLILGSSASAMFEFVIEMLLVIGAISVFHHGGVPFSYVLLPLLLLLPLLMVIGVGLFVSTCACFLDDVRHSLPVIIKAGFYLSPIFYPITMVPESIRPAYMLNPIAVLLTLYHTVLYEGRFPSLGLLAANVGVATMVIFVSYRVFNRYKYQIVELA